MPIFDQGYQHWQGPLSGHVWRWLAIARHGVRVQMKGWLVRLLLLFAWLPALALVAVLTVWGLVEQKSEGALALVRNLLPPDIVQDPRAYRAAVWTIVYSIFFKTEMYFIMLLVAVAGPGLISRDLRFNALPLYFARPLTRLDYLLGKLGVIGALVAAVAVGPAVFAYAIGLCFSLDLSVVRDTYPVLLASVAYGLVITLSAGTLILALSSLSRWSLYVGIAWAGLWIISGTVASILVGVSRDATREQVHREEMQRWVDEHPPPPGIEMQGHYPVRHIHQPPPGAQPAGAQPDPNQEADRWFAAWSRADQQSRMRGQTGNTETQRREWRWLCSYVGNLERMGDLLLDTERAWVTIGKAVAKTEAAVAAFGPPGRGRAAPAIDEHQLADAYVMLFPWQWSAGVLAGLAGLSTWTLFRRVKSLDRLR
jgi:ABC-type transport system involved in multi-copper enzyme maturation permease subunit